MGTVTSHHTSLACGPRSIMPCWLKPCHLCWIAGVAGAYRNYKVHALGTVPNDTLYASGQWYLQKIGAPDAWDITTGSEDVSTCLAVV